MQYATAPKKGRASVDFALLLDYASWEWFYYKWSGLKLVMLGLTQPMGRLHGSPTGSLPPSGLPWFIDGSPMGLPWGLHGISHWWVVGWQEYVAHGCRQRTPVDLPWATEISWETHDNATATTATNSEINYVKTMYLVLHTKYYWSWTLLDDNHIPCIWHRDNNLKACNYMW